MARVSCLRYDFSFVPVYCRSFFPFFGTKANGSAGRTASTYAARFSARIAAGAYRYPLQQRAEFRFCTSSLRKCVGTNRIGLDVCSSHFYEYEKSSNSCDLDGLHFDFLLVDFCDFQGARFWRSGSLFHEGKYFELY